MCIYIANCDPRIYASSVHTIVRAYLCVFFSFKVVFILHQIVASRIGERWHQLLRCPFASASLVRYGLFEVRHDLQKKVSFCVERRFRMKVIRKHELKRVKWRPVGGREVVAAPLLTSGGNKRNTHLREARSLRNTAREKRCSLSWRVFRERTFPVDWLVSFVFIRHVSRAETGKSKFHFTWWGRDKYLLSSSCGSVLCRHRLRGGKNVVLFSKLGLFLSHTIQPKPGWTRRSTYTNIKLSWF